MGCRPAREEAHDPWLTLRIAVCMTTADRRARFPGARMRGPACPSRMPAVARRRRVGHKRAMAGPVVRFAPSPTGLIHIGNARTALLNALFARRAGGSFVLRFDDTDLERSKPEYAEAIEQDLAWLGIAPDLVIRQSDRFSLYA